MCILCYKFEYKSTGRKCTCFWSFLATCGGGGIIFFALLLDKSEILERVEEDIEYLNTVDDWNLRQYVFLYLMVVSVFVILAGCFGMTFRWMRNKCYTVLYGTLLLPLWLVVLSFGGAAVYIAYTAADEFESECDNLIADRVEREEKLFAIADAFAKAREDAAAPVTTPTETEEEETEAEEETVVEEESSSPFEGPPVVTNPEDDTPVTDEAVEDEEDTIEFVPVVVEAPDVLQINLNIFKDVQTDKWMCTVNCPCEESEASANWIDFMNEDELIYFYERSMDYQFGPVEDSDFTVKTFEECIDRAEENQFAEEDFLIFAEAWKASPGYQEEKEQLKFFEDEYDCSGICQSALFFYSKPLQNGRPKSCFDDVKEGVKTSLFWLGWCTFGAGFFLFIVFNCQYCLWSRF